MDPLEVKKQSEAIILATGGKICEWLPYLDERKLRTHREIISRALILNAMLNIHFKAPIHIIKNWIYEHELDQFLSQSERMILAKNTNN